MKIVDVLINGIRAPIGYALSAATISWKVVNCTGVQQKNAEITVALDHKMQQIVTCLEGNLDNCGTALDLPLSQRSTYYVKVRVTADNGESAESEVASFETGKLSEPWSAHWIGTAAEDGFHPVFEKMLKLREKPVKARLYICGLGLYEASINGKKIGDELFTPFYNSYDKALQYQTYDVTDMLSGGEATLSVLLGNGWYKGRLGYEGQSQVYGDKFALIAELWLEYADGSMETVITDGSWNYKASDIESSDIYDGECINRLLHDGAEAPLHPAAILNLDKALLTERYSMPVRAMEKLAVQEIIRTPLGETVLDFGQNFSGFVEFNANLPRGTRITLRHGEILQNSNFYNDNYRSARVCFAYVSGGCPERVSPKFFFTGFRYVKVEGWVGELKKEDFTGIAVYSAMERTGWLETGHSKINRLIENALWGMKSNFLDMPTDCPQRDERLGWTGDAQVFAPTASFFMDTRAFYRKFLWDLRNDQLEHDGSIANYLPNFHHEPGGSSVWGDAAVFIPDAMYKSYGDKPALAESYPLMRDWVDWITRGDEARGAQHLFNFGFSFGDWLAMDGVTPQSMKGGTEDAYISSVYYFASAQKLANAAQTLGKQADFERYSALSEKIKAAILNEYFTPSGRLAMDTQAGFVIALYFGVWVDRQKLVDGLLTRLKKDGYRIKCGFVGAPLICEALAANGLSRWAFHLLLQEDFPSWLHCVNLGATTIWERWNSVLEDGSISGTGMNSLNHYAYGSVVNYIVRFVAGLVPVDAGYRQVLIAPQFHPSLGFADCKFNSPHGLFAVNWCIRPDGSISFRCEIPFGCTALVRLPEHEEIRLNSGVFERSYRPNTDYRKLYDWDTILEDYLKDPRAVAILQQELPVAIERTARGDIEERSRSLNDVKRMPWFGYVPSAVDKAAERLFELGKR